MNYNYNKSYSYRSSSGRSPPQANDYFDESRSSQHQSYYGASQSSMQREIPNSDPYRTAGADSSYARAQGQNSRYPNQYRNEPSSTFKTDYTKSHDEPSRDRGYRDRYDEEPPGRSYRYPSNDGRLAPRTSEVFDEPRSSQHQSYYGASQSSMQREIQNSDPYRTDQATVGDSSYAHAQGQNSRYPNQYRNEPSSTFKTDYPKSHDEVSRDRGYRDRYDEEPPGRSYGYPSNDESRSQGYNDNFDDPANEETYSDDQVDELPYSGDNYENIDDHKLPAQSTQQKVKIKKVPSLAVLGYKGEYQAKKEKKRQGRGTLPWNMTEDGRPISPSECKPRKPRLLTKPQKDALRDAVGSVLADIQRNKATFDDMPEKPIGVSIAYYRSLLKGFGVGIYKNKICLISDLEERNKKKQMKKAAKQNKPSTSGPPC